MDKILFGTDGIRGIYGESLTEDVAFRLGAALAEEGSVLIGRDNRPSSPALARALACGALSHGGKVEVVGITTTPALFYLLSLSPCECAVMVTASHNPPEHNGLKVFTKHGKPNEEKRRSLEEKMACVEASPSSPFRYTETGDLTPYKRYLKERIGSLRGIRVVLDCAGGAGGAFKGLYREMGADEITINAREDGRYINVNCGALHPEACAREVAKKRADLGISVDGDGDRIYIVTRSGRILDGDYITYLLACRMKEKGTLHKDTVAMTVMTNGGILRSLSQRGINVISTAVGDSALAETMQAEGLSLGGEQSGHVILGDYLKTGDGLLVGAAVMKSALEEGDIDSFPAPLVYPQILLNVPVKDKAVACDPALRALATRIKEELREGRVLLRASGTENVVRVMVEHPDEKVAKDAAEKLKDAVLKHS